MKKKEYTEWEKVKGVNCRVIGSAERFSISFDFEDFVRIGINGCRIVDGKHGRFISYPAWKDSKGLYHDYTFLSFYDKDDIEKIIDMF